MSDFKSLSTANLPDPPINNAENKEAVDHFNTVTPYSGTSGDKVITGVGFQPDWVWIKQTNSAADHQLYDSVRGVTKLLESNQNLDEQTKSEGLKSFDSDGFTHGVESAGNDNTGTHVGWCWNAGGTEQTATYVVKVVSDSGNKYRFDDFGSSAITLELSEGGTYRFDQSDSSNSGHPLRFSTTSNGTHGGGSEYTTGVTTNGTPGSAGAYTEITVASDAPTLYYYCSVHSGMGGQANTPSTKGYTNVKGTIQSKVVVNDTAGFSIITYTGNKTNGATVGHGLSKSPEMLMTKARNHTVGWANWNIGLSGMTYWMSLNDTAGEAVDDMYTAVSATTFTLGEDNWTNGSGYNLVTYCFHSVEGFSKFGSYLEHYISDSDSETAYNRTSPYIHTGFRPAFLMIKGTSNGRDWVIYDNKRTPDDGVYLVANTNAAEATDATNHDISFLSNGFKIRGGSGDINTTNESYIYMAFADQPFKFANGGTE